VHDQLLTRARPTNLKSDWIAVKAKRKEVKKMPKTAEINFVHRKVEESKSNSNQLWKLIRGIILPHLEG
jgi:formyltetrahydrofolate hydrolase